MKSKKRKFSYEIKSYCETILKFTFALVKENLNIYILPLNIYKPQNFIISD